MTSRGWVVLFVAVMVVTVAVNWFLRDFCWYGPCSWGP